MRVIDNFLELATVNYPGSEFRVVPALTFETNGLDVPVKEVVVPLKAMSGM